MTSDHGHFVWYELLTTDLAAAEAFYHQVLGWNAQDASTPKFAYRVLTADAVPVSGLMGLPSEGLQRGAAPRWVGYVAVDDLDAGMSRLKALGGTTYVPPTDSNIGRIAIIADPQTATLALVQGLTVGVGRRDGEGIGRVGYHELLAAEWRQAFTFHFAFNIPRYLYLVAISLSFKVNIVFHYFNFFFKQHLFCFTVVQHITEKRGKLED